MSSEYCGPLPISSKLNNSRYNEVYDLSVDSMDNLAKEGKIAPGISTIQKSGKTGFTNRKNSCFVNCILQGLRIQEILSHYTRPNKYQNISTEQINAAHRELYRPASQPTPTPTGVKNMLF
uniref:Uncharacterized protein n=1 Tax=Meloidogyne enterolobii TaxID=390850 RepID=A0A6V7WB43_MELEN|nr:unnamed protein product [Meloidogyne enterolobii]